MATANRAVNRCDDDRPHIFVFDYMRTRSHLFWRWMSTHPSLHVSYHPYMMSGFTGKDSIIHHTRNSEARQADHDLLKNSTPSDATHLESTDNLKLEIKKAEEEGKRLFTNEHTICFMNHDIQLDIIRNPETAFPSFDQKVPNPVPIPDSILDKFNPIILIRHPILQVDSLIRSMTANSQCRPGDEDFTLISSVRLSRWVFEYFKHARGGKIPIVVDGEDVLWWTHELGENICMALALELGSLKDTWKAMTEDQKHPNWFVRAMTSTMTDSTGIERPTGGKPGEPDLDCFVEKWTERYGAEMSQQLKERVEDGMPHYQRMAQYKL